MKINQTPYRTSRNYAINNIEVGEEIFNNNLHPFAKFSIKNVEGFKKTKQFKVKQNTSIAQKLDLQIAKTTNKYHVIFDKNTTYPVEIEFDFDKQNSALTDVLDFEVEENVRAQIIVKYTSKLQVYNNSLIKIHLAKNATLDICVLTNIEKESHNFVLFDNELDCASKLNYTIVDFGCKTSVQNFYTKLAGDDAKCQLNSVYFGDNNALIDLNYLQEVFGKQCTATIDVVGALRDTSAKNFKGTIDFKKGCKKSFGSENEFCMLLSKTARSKALPMLLCAEEDVDGKHSTSVGKVAEKEKFYLMSRGLNETEALKLIVKAKFDYVISKLFDKELKVEILEILDGKFENEEI